jgi:hypothetical protein
MINRGLKIGAAACEKSRLKDLSIREIAARKIGASDKSSL